MHDKSTISCLDDIRRIIKSFGDTYACLDCGQCFRSEQRDPRLRSTTENLLGRTFERLTVIDFAGYKSHANGHTKAYWQCRCIEGNIVEIAAQYLKEGRTRSCGCLSIDKLIERSTKHGKRHTPEFTIWFDMKRRCNSPNDSAYVNYGGRGITVCERWDQSFAAFLEDMGQRPTPQHSLDRLENSLGYYKENCAWSTRPQQNRNKRSNIMLTYNGVTQCATDWARQLGMKSHTLIKRLKEGWSIENALTVPVTIKNSHKKYKYIK